MRCTVEPQGAELNRWAHVQHPWSTLPSKPSGPSEEKLEAWIKTRSHTPTTKSAREVTGATDFVACLLKISRYCIWFWNYVNDVRSHSLLFPVHETATEQIHRVDGINHRVNKSDGWQ